METWPRASQIIYVKLLCGGKMRPLTNHVSESPAHPPPCWGGANTCFHFFAQHNLRSGPPPPSPNNNKMGDGGRGAWLQVMLGKEVKASICPAPQGNTSWWIRGDCPRFPPGIQRLSPNLLKAWFCTITLHICTSSFFGRCYCII